MKNKSKGKIMSDDNEFKEIHEKIEKIKKEHKGNLCHGTKRIISFEIFDCLLEDCNRNKCPEFDPKWGYYLCDISLDGYIRERAYYDYICGVGIDDKERYFTGEQKIQQVLNCKNKPAFNANVLVYDSEAIFKSSNTLGRYYVNARRRKAFWTYLKNNKTGNPFTDFCKASNFMNFIHKTAMSKKVKAKDLMRARQAILLNKDIANPLDLFRVCFIRKKIISQNHGTLGSR